MKLVVLGGHDRLRSRATELAKRYNITVKFINQETQQNIDSALACADFVIIFTSLDRCIFCNSHGVCALEKNIIKLIKLYKCTNLGKDGSEKKPKNS
jgi:predicted TIM-barrel fold metal-dependent hydrolase